MASNCFSRNAESATAPDPAAPSESSVLISTGSVELVGDNPRVAGLLSTTEDEVLRVGEDFLVLIAVCE